ncbi:hypothetical protein cand_002850 [Cryptosporidium andersoni]|uniref:Uncharacterized protein n=1 Tax=Cryptosporidium andersoni TaxID=117008 RepID=A0A1J4MNR6_9CRYT|nr:hypothetical protein cand_002850 [Cryptosporidium andersoni]
MTEYLTKLIKSIEEEFITLSYNLELFGNSLLDKSLDEQVKKVLKIEHTTCTTAIKCLDEVIKVIESQSDVESYMKEFCETEISQEKYLIMEKLKNLKLKHKELLESLKYQEEMKRVLETMCYHKQRQIMERHKWNEINSCKSQNNNSIDLNYIQAITHINSINTDQFNLDMLIEHNCEVDEQIKVKLDDKNSKISLNEVLKYRIELINEGLELECTL